MTTKEVADKIMNHMAKQNAKPNHAFGVHQLNIGLFSRANPKEQDLIIPAIESLVQQQFVTIEDRHGSSLVLTQHGYEQLYPVNAGTNEKLGKMIMDWFAKQHSRPNHTLDFRNLQFTIIDKLNPKEREMLPDAIEALVAEGLITEEDRNGECLVLTQKGYDTLY